MNKWQVFFLIVLTLPIMGHVVLLPLTIEFAGRDSWIAALCSLPIGVLFLIGCYYAWGKLHLDTPTRYSLEVGKGIQVATRIILYIYFLFLSSLSLAALIEMTNVAFLQQTPTWALVISFLLLVMYGATKELQGIALTAGILFFVVMLSGHSITFLHFPEREFLDLFPILENGWKPVLIGTLVLSTCWIELLFILVLPIDIRKEKRLFSVFMLGLLANVGMILSTTTGTIMTFGLGQAKSFLYPALETIRIIDLDFIDRLDIYALILMTFGCYIRGSLFLKISHLQLTSLVQKKHLTRGCFILVSVLVGILAYYFGATRAQFEVGLQLYLYTLLLYPLPFLLLLIAWMRKRTKNGSS